MLEFDLADDIVRWELQPDDSWERSRAARPFEPDAQERMYRWTVEQQARRTRLTPASAPCRPPGITMRAQSAGTGGRPVHLSFMSVREDGGSPVRPYGRARCRSGTPLRATAVNNLTPEHRRSSTA